ncbi:MAG: asparagine synthase (glutamine-hydrolyzing) [Bacteroidia bacterium]|nr:asparagine synthase (glutamine-hydrolyzing) [Bacteroidia bacterium]MCX7652190.1 asparagine synthase (glutamine-hydrolyzing) [Bacteroidia bacterium]MDW8416452.1 asparagine synthase (glutamine-hydrolyzing) [Bacteroidia bacterium]
MCGIAGFWGEGGEKAGWGMIDTLRHRGPDYQGVWSEGKATLAHARLSILDLDPRSHQPFFSPDGRYTIVFNGEIYNFQALREKLQKEGAAFRTTSDTEVLLEAYVRWGKDCLKLLRGMFAFAIYDRMEKVFFLARDPMGKKPLYYTFQGGIFAFASEIKALWAHPRIPRRLSVPALHAYLVLDYVPTPYAIGEGISKLEGGHYMVVKEGELVERASYWQPPFPSAVDFTLEEATQKLDGLLAEAVRLRMIADVPVGVFLSGGIDSSTVAWYAQKQSGSPILTFSIGFTEESYDESDYALRVAKLLGTEHYAATLTPEKTLELVEEVFPLMDEPFADASILPTYFLSQFARQRVIVALGGDGGDELQAGYPTFIADRYAWLLSPLPRGVVLSLSKLAERLLPARDENIALDFKVRQFLRGFTGKAVERHTRWLASFLPEEIPSLLHPDYATGAQDILSTCLAPYLSRVPAEATLDSQTAYLYYKTYLQDDILVKVDRASMYNALEVRAPLLDKEVVGFLAGLPMDFRRRGNQTKLLLKKLMKGRLPDEILFRPKKGFGIPLSRWLRYELRAPIQAELMRPDPWFRPEALQNLWNVHQSRKANYRKLLWNLYTFKRFARQWGLG